MSIPGPDDIQRYTLPNGIVVLVRENFTSPAVVVRGYLPAGACYERSEQAGLAAFTADAVARGTAKRTFAHIYEEVESVGASFGVSSGVHTTGFGGKSLAEDLPLVLDVLADVLRFPTFPGDEVARLQGEIITALEERAHNTSAMANLAFYELAYPMEHPYARSVSGYIETVRKITPSDLAEFHATRYTPQGMVIVVVGAVKSDEALERIGQAFGDWEGPAPQPVDWPQVPKITEVRERFVPIHGKMQADIVLGYPGPARSSPDYLDAVVCNTILGVFGLMGRLGDTVRDSQGLAYYSYSRLDGGLGPGPWRIVAGVHPTNVERAVAGFRAEIRRIREQPVDEVELAENKSFITGSLPLRLETNEGVAGAIVNMERYGLGLDYLQRYAALIAEIDAKRVQEVARRWLDPDAYALAVAGPPSD